MVNNEQLKEIIGRIKHEKKLNQEEVAELLGVKNPYLSGMTNGKYPVTENVLRKISEIFGSIHQILPLICSLR
jgi:transcriptional regulator with XRE-family HTH domain